MQGYHIERNWGPFGLLSKREATLNPGEEGSMRLGKGRLSLALEGSSLSIQSDVPTEVDLWSEPEVYCPQVVCRLENEDSIQTTRRIIEVRTVGGKRRNSLTIFRVGTSPLEFLASAAGNGPQGTAKITKYLR